MIDWRPGTSNEILKTRANLLQTIRQFFQTRNVLEIETPLLCSAGVTDPGLTPFYVSTQSLESLSVTERKSEMETNGNTAVYASTPFSAPHSFRYLQTSPEYAMKRLLAAGSGDIYQICKAFRAGEIGRKHNPEYTLLEWYRLGFDHYQLIRETAELIVNILGRPSWEVWPWGKLFQEILSVDIHRASEEVLAVLVQKHIGPLPDDLDRNGLLDLLMSHCIEPAIAEYGVVFVVDYPASQAALAKKIESNNMVFGARFECYVDGIELANGYWECTDAEEIRMRFEEDNRTRKRRGLIPTPIDERLLSAMERDFPECAGVALGVDRLLMLKLGTSSLSETMPFDWQRS